MYRTILERLSDREKKLLDVIMAQGEFQNFLSARRVMAEDERRRFSYKKLDSNIMMVLNNALSGNIAKLPGQGKQLWTWYTMIYAAAKGADYAKPWRDFLSHDADYFKLHWDHRFESQEDLLEAFRFARDGFSYVRLLEKELKKVRTTGKRPMARATSAEEWF